ncbi:MAG: hypothetical protein WCI03_10055 [bacterium]
MASQIKQIETYIRRLYPDFESTTPPKWSRKTQWCPALFLRSKITKRYLAIAIELSGRLPTSVFRDVVVPLKQKQPGLVVVVCVTEKGLADFPETETECRDMGVGLKSLQPHLGLATIVKTDIDPQQLRTIDHETGYFPKAILDQAEGLSRLMFCDTLNHFIKNIRRIQKSDESKIKKRTLELVYSTIESLIAQHPSFTGATKEFMKLAHFEQLFDLVNPGSSEHVIHAFRVFLAGCPIVNKFYNVFDQAHRRYSDRCHTTRIEYAWLLTSIFHDIGRVKEGARQYATAILRDELNDEDMTINIAGSPNRWKKPGYRNALKLLGSLAAFMGDKDTGNWDGGAFADEAGDKLEIEWIRIYDEYKWHGVIGSIDFLRTVCENAKAANERQSRPFVLAHAVPAALAIMLHDWRVHADGKKWNLVPLSTKRFPLASLLHYVDTWDDYKRKGDKACIAIKQYKINNKQAHVLVEWAEETLLKNEQIKYNAFTNILRDQTFRMTIEARMASPNE